jgi:uncharacterized protein YjlB
MNSNISDLDKTDAIEREKERLKRKEWRGEWTIRVHVFNWFPFIRIYTWIGGY